jgi:KRAB domain-containing zinc finger protein
LCDKRFYQETAAIKHFDKSHCDNGPFLCPECGSGFPTQEACTEHRPHHISYVIRKINPSKYTNLPRHESCPICGKKYAPSRKRHILIQRHIESVHENKNDFKCDLCEKAFPTQEKLRRHKRRHFKNDQCSICRNRVDSIKEHYEIFHSNLKETCQICYKKFQAPCYLRKHMMWSHEEKQFQCDLCGHSYCDLQTIRRHVKIHIGGRVARGRVKVAKLSLNVNVRRESDFSDSD